MTNEGSAADWMRKHKKRKADRLNADFLLSGNIIFTIRAIERFLADGEGRIKLFPYEDYPPWVPCYTVVKILSSSDLWGGDEQQWIGNKLELFLDKTVRFGKDAVGGIRVHGVHPLQKDKVMITHVSRRGQRAITTIKRIKETAKSSEFAEASLQMHAAETESQLSVAAERAKGLLPVEKDALRRVYLDRLNALEVDNIICPETDEKVSLAWCKTKECYAVCSIHKKKTT
jgi:hypothetical protein